MRSQYLKGTGKSTTVIVSIHVYYTRNQVERERKASTTSQADPMVPNMRGGSDNYAKLSFEPFATRVQMLRSSY